VDFERCQVRRGMALHDRVVDNHIVSLRRKLEPDPVPPRFEA